MEQIKKIFRVIVRSVCSAAAKVLYASYSFFKYHELKLTMMYLPLVDGKRSFRNDASKKRLDVIRSEITRRGAGKKYSILDIGCNNGYFGIHLAKDGHFYTGIDGFPVFLNPGRFFIEYNKIKSVGLAEMLITPENVSSLPCADILIFLSVFQKLAKQYGFKKASDILVGLWSKTGEVMFFEMPDSLESIEIFKGFLPEMGKTKEACNQFIKGFLKDLLKPAEIKIAGEFEMEYRNEKRTMFVIKK